MDERTLEWINESTDRQIEIRADNKPNIPLLISLSCMKTLHNYMCAPLPAPLDSPPRPSAEVLGNLDKKLFVSATDPGPSVVLA